MFRYISILSIMIFPVVMSGCIYDSPRSFRSANFDAEARMVDEFTVVELKGNYSVQLENADSCSLEILADEEMMDLILTEVRNGVLTVRTMNQSGSYSRKRVELILKVPVLERLNIVASANIYSESPFVFDRLFIESSGALKMDMELKGNLLEGDLAGASNLNLRGDVKEVWLNLPGAGKISAFGLITRNFILDFSGAGKAEVFATGQLDVDLSGTCMVSYKGNPEKVFSNVSGIGRVKEIK